MMCDALGRSWILILSQVIVTAALVPAVGGTAPPPPSNEQIRVQIREVTALPEFSGQQQIDWWQRFLEWLANVIGWLGGLRAASPLVFWLLLVGAVAALLILAGHIAWTFRKVMRVDRRLQHREEGKEERRRLSLTHWECAKLRAANGDFTEAIRYLFLSLVYHFDESGRVLFQQAFTNREYLSLFADRPEVRSELTVFVDALDEHWYGQRPTDKSLYESCLSHYENLK